LEKIQDSADMDAKGSLEAVMASLKLDEGTIDNLKEYGNAVVHDIVFSLVSRIQLHRAGAVRRA
jgi:hypothetical protein